MLEVTRITFRIRRLRIVQVGGGSYTSPSCNASFDVGPAVARPSMEVSSFWVASLPEGPAVTSPGPGNRTRIMNLSPCLDVLSGSRITNLSPCLWGFSILITCWWLKVCVRKLRASLWLMG
jgi:hypothetical protein